MKLNMAIKEFMKLYQTWVKSDHSEEKKFKIHLVPGDFSEAEKAQKSLYVFLKGHKKLMDALPSTTECGLPPEGAEDVMSDLSKEFKKHLGAQASKFYNAAIYTAAWANTCMANIKNSKFREFYKSANGLAVFFTSFVMQD